MAHKSKKAPTARKEANKRFQSRYGMTRSEWAGYKKKEPQKAHEKRMSVLARM